MNGRRKFLVSNNKVGKPFLKIMPTSCRRAKSRKIKRIHAYVLMAIIDICRWKPRKEIGKAETEAFGNGKRSRLKTKHVIIIGLTLLR